MWKTQNIFILYLFLIKCRSITEERTREMNHTLRVGCRQYLVVCSPSGSFQSIIVLSSGLHCLLCQRTGRVNIQVEGCAGVRGCGLDFWMDIHPSLRWWFRSLCPDRFECFSCSWGERKSNSNKVLLRGEERKEWRVNKGLFYSKAGAY